MGIGAAFSPKDFKAWVVEETKTGNNAGALDSPVITSGLFQLDVDSVAFPSIAPNQVIDKRTNALAGRVFHSLDFYQDNTLRPTEVSLSGTFRNNAGMAILLQSVTGTDLNGAPANVSIPYNSTCQSGKYGETEDNKTFTLVLAPPDTTDGYNIIMVGCLCTNFSISADAGSDGGLYKWSASISSGQKPITNNTATEAGTAVYTAASPISISTLTGATTVNSIASTIMSNFNVTIDSPAVYTGVGANGFAHFSRGAETSVTATTQIKYDSTTRPIINNFNTQTENDDALMLVLTQATAAHCSIAIQSGVLTSAALSEGDIMMIDIEIKAAVHSTTDVIAITLA